MRRILLCFSLCLFAITVSGQAKTGELIYREWAKLGESSNHVDIFYRLVKCGEKDQMQVLIFNESNIDQLAKFTLHLTGHNNRKYSTDMSFFTRKAEMYQPECGNNDALAKLRVDLPSGMSPDSVKVSISFNF